LGSTPRRRATCRATAPGARLAATTVAFSSADQRRRRGVPLKISSRRKLCSSIGKLVGQLSMPRPPYLGDNSNRSARRPQGVVKSALTPQLVIEEIKPGAARPPPPNFPPHLRRRPRRSADLRGSIPTNSDT